MKVNFGNRKAGWWTGLRRSRVAAQVNWRDCAGGGPSVRGRLSALGLAATAGMLAVVPRAAGQIAIIDYPSGFADQSGLAFAGSGALSAGKLRVCPARYGDRGAVWARRRARVSAGFETQFTFRISNPGSTPGADGFTFAVQGTGLGAIGGTGGDMGYTGIARSIVVEFDTWANGDGCSSENNNHVAVHSRGLLPNTTCASARLGTANVPFNLKDGQVHRARVSYASGMLRVFFDGSSSPTLSVAVDLGAVNGGSFFDSSGRAWVGFTAGTGGAWNDHDVLTWSLTESDCRPTPRITPTSASACVGGEVSFGVESEGVGPFSFQWRRNGIPIEPVDNPTASSSTLVLVEVGEFDDGIYDCVVTNACGAASSNAVSFVTCACLPCPADFNQDGGIDGGDVEDFFAAWEAGDCDADVDADGGVGGPDTNAFFVAWENGGC